MKWLSLAEGKLVVDSIFVGTLLLRGYSWGWRNAIERGIVFW